MKIVAPFGPHVCRIYGATRSNNFARFVDTGYGILYLRPPRDMNAIFVDNIVYKAAWKRFENFKRWNTSVYGCMRHNETNRANFIIA